MQLTEKTSQLLHDYFVITLGCLLYSFSFVAFFQTNNLAMGGFTGLAQIIHHFFEVIPIGSLVFLMNIPLLVIGFKKEGIKLLFASFYAIALSSIIIDVFTALFTFPKFDELLACIFGSTLMGLSLGIMMCKSATTGGTELLARLLKYKVQHLSIGKLCLIIDVVVLIFYALIFNRLEYAMYGIIEMYISSIALDYVVYGSSNGKIAYIISEKNTEIKQKLISLGFGVTVIYGRGGFSDKNTSVLLCTVRRNKIHTIKKAISIIDPQKAFVIVCDAKEVLGEGFGDYNGIGF